MKGILFLALALAIVAWLFWDVTTSCDQNCDQGRKCTRGANKKD